MARLGAEGTCGSGGPAVLVAVAKLLAPPAPHGLGEDGADVKGQVGGADVGGWLGVGECKDKDLGGPSLRNRMKDRVGEEDTAWA